MMADGRQKRVGYSPKLRRTIAEAFAFSFHNVSVPDHLFLVHRHQQQGPEKDFDRGRKQDTMSSGKVLRLDVENHRHHRCRCH